MRFALALLLVAACSTPPKPEPTAAPWYAQSTTELRDLTERAAAHLRRKQPDKASELIQQAQPLSARLIGVPRPTLAATEAASDLDDLYGRMLLANRHYGWARLQFQKNVARWTHWRPQTDNTRRRLATAQSAIAECDRHLTKSIVGRSF